MIKNPFSGRIGMWIRLAMGLALMVGGSIAAVYLCFFRVYVPPGYCLVRIAKMGSPMPAGQSVAEPGQKGIQRETWGPGRYWINPITWDTELVPLVEVKAGRPDTWTWVHTSHRLPQKAGDGPNILNGEMPEVGILIRKSGQSDPSGSKVVDMKSPYTGIVREVLTPGVYRINPYEYEVQKAPAVVIPAGFVGVLTNQLGIQPEMIEVPDMPIDGGTASTEPAVLAMKKIRPLASVEKNERGTLKDVLPPGVYYVNPNVQRIKISEVGYNEFSQLSSRTAQDTIRFPSKSGFDIELGVTVVYGLHPRNAAAVINEFGTTQEVLEKVIKPQLRSICRNQGSLYEARDFIQGDKREEFQNVLTTSLKNVCKQKNIELLLALISTIDVYSGEGKAQEGETDLRTAIQDSYLAIERQITNTKLQDAEKKRAMLEEAKKNVDIMRESIEAETRKKVATIAAEGQRKAAEIAATGKLEVATLEQQIAMLDAEKTEVLGRAEADVEKLKKQADADGKKMLVQAFGNAAAYNLYTFAENFEPESIQMIFAGEGTFWTDLKRFEEIGGAQLMRQSNRATTRPRP